MVVVWRSNKMNLAIPETLPKPSMASRSAVCMISEGPQRLFFPLNGESKTHMKVNSVACGSFEGPRKRCASCTYIRTIALPWITAKQ